MDKLQLNQFLDRYVSMWHESDASAREALVRSLWAVDAENFTNKFAVRGIDAILQRVARANQDWVVAKKCMFRSAGNTDFHNFMVKFFWEMLPISGGPLEARGLDIFVLNKKGLIQALYQFGEPLNP